METEKGKGWEREREASGLQKNICGEHRPCAYFYANRSILIAFVVYFESCVHFFYTIQNV